MPALNWNDLPVFLAIAEHGTLAGAARALAVNHSTVFRRLQALEAELGVALFERGPEGYRLSEAGAEALPQAELARDAVDQILRRTAGRDATLSGRVRLTTAPDLAVQVVPPALARLAERHPGIRVDVVVSDSDQDLARREADLALRATMAPPEGLVGRRLREVDWWFHAHPDTSAEDAPLIGASTALLRVGAFRRLHEAFPEERFAAWAGSLELMEALARAQIGVALLPSNYQPEGLMRRDRFEAAAPSELWLLFHPDLRSVARVRAVADVLQEIVTAGAA
ncbi:MAG: LysR family transcriptional regulator [Pseudomonadota bacterium]